MRTRPCKGCLAAPALEEDTGAGADLHGVGRQKFNLDLESARIRDFKEWIAGGDDALALVHDLQDPAADRGANRYGLSRLLRLLRGGMTQGGSCRLKIMASHFDGVFGGPLLRLAAFGRCCNFVEDFVGDRARGMQFSCSFALRLPAAGLGVGGFHVFLRALEVGLCRRDPRLRLGAAPGVENRGAQRVEKKQCFASLDDVAHVGVEPPREAVHGRRNHKAIDYTGLPFFFHGHLQRTALDDRRFNRDRPGHEAPNNRGHDPAGQQQPEQNAPESHRFLFIRLQDRHEIESIQLAPHRQGRNQRRGQHDRRCEGIGTRLNHKGEAE